MPCASARICAPGGTPPKITEILKGRPAGEIAEALRDLAGEFARRAEDERARSALGRRTRIGEKLVEDRQREGGRLARARLGDADEIAARHQGGNCLRLNGRRLLVTHVHERVDERLGEAETIKIFQLGIFQTAARANRAKSGQGSFEGNAPRVRASVGNAKGRTAGGQKPFTRPARIDRWKSRWPLYP